LDKSYEEKYHDIEEWNWWFVARRQAILSLIKSTPRNARILDIGCAGGPLLSELGKQGFTNAAGADFSAEAVAKCKGRGLEAYQMDAHDLQFADNSFDLLIASDSLEHLEKDEQALASWLRVLKPGGRILVFVPAYMFLWSEQDTVNYHFRRYTKTELVGKMKNAGFEVTRKGYWNFGVFFPTAVFRLLQRLKNKIAPSKNAKDQLSGFGGFSNKILTAWMGLENKIFRALPFPVGVSAYAEARKPIK
jgi:SAM-dependent methyltransferase